eukprot:SAG11_NODE_2499_length_3286_cov_6.125824_1_plen_81_part_10
MIRGLDSAQQAIKASLVLEVVVVAAEVGEDTRGEDLWKVTATDFLYGVVLCYLVGLRSTGAPPPPPPPPPRATQRSSPRKQ